MTTLVVITVLLFVSFLVNNRLQKRKKEIYDEELQSFYSIGRLGAKMLGSNWGVSTFKYLMEWPHYPVPENLNAQEIFVRSNTDDDLEIRTVIYSPKHQEGNLPAMLYVHGGGYEIGSPDQAIVVINAFIKERPMIVVAPSYRLSQKYPYPAAFNDCYDVLLWMKKNGENYQFDTDKFVIAGHSAGGGMTAALSLKARDTKAVKVAFQLPIYPMIDHRQNTESALASKYTPIWDKRSNKLAWDNYLKGLRADNEEIPIYASPATNENYSDLPPTITFVGSQEPFKDETVNYVNSLREAGIEVRFKLFEGAFHAFEVMVPKAKISKDANSFLMSSYRDFYDEYLAK